MLCLASQLQSHLAHSLLMGMESDSLASLHVLCYIISNYDHKRFSSRESFVLYQFHPRREKKNSHTQKK